MPDSMSIERRRLMLAYGASFELTDRAKGMQGAVDRATEMLGEIPGSWMPQQFDNPANVEVHVRTTAQEVLADFRDAPFDALITGVGTGGHITGLRAGAQEGMARASRCSRSSRRCRRSSTAASPARTRSRGSAPISFPRILDTRNPRRGDRRRCRGRASEMARRAAREEGMLIGISSGAALAAIAQKLPELGDRPRILTFNYDSGERYLSVPDFLPEEG